MLRVTLSNLQAKRTIRPLYAFSQSTPKAVFLDPAWNSVVPIYAGMALAKTVGDMVTLVGDGTTGPVLPYGLAGFMEGVPNIENEISNQGGTNAASVWVLAPDAEFEILAPAFDSTATWLDVGTGAPILVYAYLTGVKRGQLCPAPGGGTGIGTTISSKPVARLLKVSSPSKIVIGGLDPNMAVPA